jgi:plastocyanin
LHFVRRCTRPVTSGVHSVSSGLRSRRLGFRSTLSDLRWTTACWRALLAALAVAGSAVSVAADVEVAVHDLNAQPLMDVVVFAEPVDAATAPPVHATAHALIDQVDKEFVPLVTIVRVGTEVSFPNSDNIRHSIYSFSAAKPFTMKLYSGKQAPPVIFDKAGVVVLGCNIHDMMAAWVVVVDTPYFAKTSASGTAVLKGLAPGDYHVSVWYPGPTVAPSISDVHVGAEGDAHLEVKVDGSASSLPALRARAAQTKP